MVRPLSSGGRPPGAQFSRREQTPPRESRNENPENTRNAGRPGGDRPTRREFGPPQGGLDPKANFEVTQGLRNRDTGNTGNSGTANNSSTPSGNSGPISAEEISQAAGGDAEIEEKLNQMAQDPEGAEALRVALDKGTTFKRGELEGNTAGLTTYRSGQPPEITLESMNIDVVAHEVFHAAYEDMDHDEVYEAGRRVARNLGETPIT